MFAAGKRWIKRTPLLKPLIFAKGLVARPMSQNEEALILKRLLSRYDVPTRFVEFGFSGWEFNCASLADRWSGLLIDGDQYNVTIARTILASRIKSDCRWITLESLDIVRAFASGGGLGILSVDVDGNDYWFLDALVDLAPSIIIVEYNSSFGARPITCPYDPHFDRTVKHESRLYYGASLSAVTHLAERNGYSLIDVTQSGINAFFVRSDLLTGDDLPLKAEHAFRERLFPDGARPSQQWEKIKHLPFVDVTAGPPSGARAR